MKYERSKNNKMCQYRIYCVYSSIIPVIVSTLTCTILSCVRPMSMTISHIVPLRVADLNTTGELYCSRNFLAICIALRILASVFIDKKSSLPILS